MENIAAAALNLPDVTENTSTGPIVQATYGGGLDPDAGAFAESMGRAAQAVESTSSRSAVTQALMAPLDHLNLEAARLEEYATEAMASDNEMSPSEIVMLTARSQEFMFHAQLTSNVANRTADGLQQLFRQQS
jgi:hypothetical protein